MGGPGFSLRGIEDETSIQYQLEEDEEAPPEMCKRDELGVLTILMADKIVNEALNLGIRVIFDIEPVLYESVLQLYAMVTYCSKFILTEENGVVVGSDDKPYKLSMTIFKIVKPFSNEIQVNILRENRDAIWDELEMVIVNPRMVNMYVVKSRPSSDVSVAVVFDKLASQLLRDTFRLMYEYSGSEEWLLKAQLIGRVPYDILLTLPLDSVKSVASRWVPPPPPHSDLLRKKSRTLDELILPKSLKQELWKLVEVARHTKSESLLLIGLPASGKKTIGKALASTLSIPAYHLSITNLLSRWVGESEAKMKEFFAGIRGTGGLAVFEDIHNLYKKEDNSGVASNLRSVLYQEMQRDDNNFIIIFTSNTQAPPEILESPLIGEFKLVVPLPNMEERKSLARLFLRELVGDMWELLLETAKKQYDVDNKTAEQYVYNIYADPFAGASAGMTSGELYRSMKRIIIPAVDEIKRRGRLVDISDDIISLTRRDFTARQAELRNLKMRAIMLGYVDIADSILEVEKEVRSKAIEVAKLIEKYKDY